MQFVAGTHKQYNNLAYRCLQFVIENVSGLDLETYLQQNILGPLGMADTSFMTRVATPTESWTRFAWPRLSIAS